jgi:2-haloacid dehalogenase
MVEKKKVQAVIFDFGNVLVGWSPYNLYRKTLMTDEEIKAFLDEIDFKNWNPQFDRGYPFEKGVAEKIAKFPHRADLIRLFDERWIEAMGEFNHGTIEILHKLKAAGYPVYGLSNWSLEKFNQVRDEFDFLKVLDDFVISGQVKQIKPEPDIFFTLLKRITRTAEECVFIDDSMENIEAARKLGFQTVLFLSAEQLADEMANLGIRY